MYWGLFWGWEVVIKTVLEQDHFYSTFFLFHSFERVNQKTMMICNRLCAVIGRRVAWWPWSSLLQRRTSAALIQAAWSAEALWIVFSKWISWTAEERLQTLYPCFDKWGLLWMTKEGRDLESNWERKWWRISLTKHRSLEVARTPVRRLFRIKSVWTHSF